MTGSGPQIPRRFKRYPLPSSLAVVSVEVRLYAGAELLVGKLWDISPAGTCLVLPGNQSRLCPGDEGELTVRDPHSSDELTLGFQVRWVEADNMLSFVGCQFVEGILDSDGFLAPYFKVSWVDAMVLQELEGFE